MLRKLGSMVGPGEDECLDVSRPLRGDVGGDLGAAGVPDEENVVEPARVQPLREGVGELGDVERVWRLSAAREAGQLDEVRAGPGAEFAHGRLEVVGDGQAGDDDHLGDADARGADRSAAHRAPGGGAVLDRDVGVAGVDRHAARRYCGSLPAGAALRSCG
jgi:hypothetical protein